MRNPRKDDAGKPSHLGSLAGPGPSPNKGVIAPVTVIRNSPCIPGRKSRTKPVKYDKRRYKSRNRIEIMFGRLKDWRRVATRYDRCPTVFLSAVALAATVLFWL